MPVSILNFGGLNIACLLFGHEWSTALSLQIRFPGDVTAGESDREARRPIDEALRFKASVHLVLQDVEAQALRQQLATLGTGWVGIPIPSDKLLGADWATRIFDSQVVLEFDTPLLQSAGAARDNAKTYAPLLVGHFENLPEITPLTDNLGELTLELTEDSPWAFRVGVNAAGVAGTWPPELVPDWAEPLTDLPTQGLTFESIGEQRERQIENVEIPFHWGQDAKFALLDRDSIRTLLAFFVASQGLRQNFDQPWWFQPGAPTAEAPASTKVRFATDTLQVDFETDGIAAAVVRVLQVPWEIVGVVGETPVQPARIYFYKFTHNLPVPQVSRYTNWVRPLTRAGDGTYVPSPTKHQQIGESIDLKPEDLIIDSFIFAGNPLMLFVPFVLEAPLLLEIWEAETDPINPDGATLRWTGEVKYSRQTGRRISATCSFLGNIATRTIPTPVMGLICNTTLFSPTCGISQAANAKAGTFTAADAATTTLTITTAAADAANWYAHGWIEIGVGATFERRAIVSSAPVAGGQRLVVDWPVRQAAAGQAVTFYPGCDLTFPVCQAKWNNRARFFAHPNLPQINLSLPSATVPSSGGKK